jgi:hypothetical protein
MTPLSLLVVGGLAVGAALVSALMMSAGLRLWRILGYLSLPVAVLLNGVGLASLVREGLTFIEGSSESLGPLYEWPVVHLWLAALFGIWQFSRRRTARTRNANV